MTDFSTPPNFTIPSPTPTSQRDAINRALGNRAVYASSGPEDTGAEPFVAPPPTGRQSGQRHGATVVLGSDGVAEVLTTNDGLFFNAGSPQARFVDDNGQPTTPKADNSPPVFMKEGTDSRILAKDADMSDLVDLGGRIGVTTLGSALHNGWLQERDGGYVKAGDAAPPKPARPAKASMKATADADGDDSEADAAPTAKATEPAAPERDYLPHADEAMLRDVERHVGADTYQAAEAFLMHGEEIPERIMSQLAAKFGGDRAAAQQAVAQAIQPFAMQAASVVERFVGEGNADLVWEFGRSNPQAQAMMRDAMKAQANERSTAGYAKLAREFLIAEAARDPQAVVDGIIRGGGRARVEGKRVLVDLGKKGGGWTEFAAAIRGGII